MGAATRRGARGVLAVLAIALLVAGTATSLTLLHHRELGAVPGSVRWHSGQVSEFDGDFYLESDLVLPDTGTFQVASIHSLDIGRKGEFLIADIRNSNVKVFNQEGEPLAVVGRYGGGLGEFRLLYEARFLPKGGLAAVDPGQRRIVVFNARFEPDTSFVTTRQDPRSLLGLGDSLLIVAGLTEPTRRGQLLVVYHRRGSVLTAFLPADSRLFQVHMVVDQPWVAVNRLGQILGGLELVPDVYVYDFQGRLSLHKNVNPPGWRQLEPTPSKAFSPSELKRWIGAATIISGVAVDDSNRLLLEYQTRRGDSTVYRMAVYDDRLEPLWAYTDIPGRLMSQRRGALYLTRADSAGRFHISVYKQRAPAAGGDPVQHARRAHD